MIEMTPAARERLDNYRGSHRLRTGKQTIEVIVARPPARAELDPDHELLDRNTEDNAVFAGSGVPR